LILANHRRYQGLTIDSNRLLKKNTMKILRRMDALI